MIRTAIIVLSTLFLGIFSNAYAQSDDLGSVMDKAQKSLNQKAENSIGPTSLEGDYKIYENHDYLKLQYPSDWVHSEKIGPVDGSPDQIFSVSFNSPPNKKPYDWVLVWFTVEKNSKTTSLEERKNTLYANLKKIPEIVKDIVQSPTELSGVAAYRTDYFDILAQQNNTGIEAIQNDLIYTFSFSAEPDTLDKHMNSIQKMMQTAKITPIDVTNTAKGNPSSPSKPVRTSAPPQDKQNDCDPSYPDFCIPPPPPNLNCPDISQKRFTVSGSDPHGFDRDNDGVGCES